MLSTFKGKVGPESEQKMTACMLLRIRWSFTYMHFIIELLIGLSRRHSFIYLSAAVFHLASLLILSDPEPASDGFLNKSDPDFYLIFKQI